MPLPPPEWGSDRLRHAAGARAGEDRQKPLSDTSLQKKLAAGGIKVARRTVAKYREQLGILPSHLRKSF